MKQYLFLFILLVTTAQTHSILIITHAYNRPDFIEMQYETFQSFLKDPYTYLVFNDAPNDSLKKEIEDTCNRLGVQCISIPQSVHSKNYPVRFKGEPLNVEIRCAQSMQYSLMSCGFDYEGIVALIDSDVFLVKSFSISEFMRGYDCAGILHSKKSLKYFGNGVVFFDFSCCPDKYEVNFLPGKIENIPLGIGGHTYYYLLNHLNINYKHIDKISVFNFPLCLNSDCLSKKDQCPHEKKLFEGKDFDEHQIKFLAHRPPNIEFFCGNTFLHYRCGSNWNAKSLSYIEKKTKMVQDYLFAIINANKSCK